MAGAVSNCIVENCLHGHDSHGMCLVPRFIKSLEAGRVDPEATAEVVKTSATTARIDGRRGFGQLTMIDAMNVAVGMAEEAGVSAVTVTNCNHVGILWTFAKMAAEKGMIAMVWCSSGPQGGLVAPHGGVKKAIGANPVGIGIPAGSMKPMVIDISTSAAAGGTIVLHAQQGKKIPLGWLLDENGKATTDPNELIKDGKIVGIQLPMAGHKGFCLGMVGEILGGILAGYGPAYVPDYKEGNAAFILTVDVKRFLPLAEFGAQVDALLRHVKSVPTDAETDEIMIPGEPEFRTMDQRERDGIPVTDAVWADILAVAERLGVSIE